MKSTHKQIPIHRHTVIHNVMLNDQCLTLATLRVRGTDEAPISAFSRLEPIVAALIVELLGTAPLDLTVLLFPFSLRPVVIKHETPNTF